MSKRYYRYYRSFTKVALALLQRDALFISLDGTQLQRWEFSRSVVAGGRGSVDECSLWRIASSEIQLCESVSEQFPQQPSISSWVGHSQVRLSGIATGTPLLGTEPRLRSQTGVQLSPSNSLPYLYSPLHWSAFRHSTRLGLKSMWAGFISSILNPQKDKCLRR